MLILICILAIIISQIYLAMQRESRTEDAVLFTTRHSISFTGVIVRDETPVYSSDIGSGILNYCVEDGSRLSKKSQIARVFSSYDQIYNRYRIERINAELDVLKKAQDRGTTDYVQPEFISSQISEQYKKILSDIKTNNLKSLNDDRLDILKLMCIMNVSSNVESDYNSRIEKLTSERNSLSASLTDPILVINAADSGYFTSETDGYESLLKIEDIGKLSADDINSVIESPEKRDNIGSNVIGKVFSDYSWKMVGVINTPDRYFANHNFDLICTTLGKTYSAKVESITPTGKGDEAIIVLSCDEMDATIAAARVVDVELLFSEYTGIRISRKAIRFKDGIKGVYVLQGENMVFKALDVIYEGDDYVLSKMNADGDFLNLYDRVLLDPVPTVQTDDDENPDSEPESSAQDSGNKE